MSETPPPYRTNHHHQDIVKHTEILDAYEDHKKSFDGEDDEEDLSLSTNEILNNANLSPYLYNWKVCGFSIFSVKFKKELTDKYITKIFGVDIIFPIIILCFCLAYFPTFAMIVLPSLFWLFVFLLSFDVTHTRERARPTLRSIDSDHNSPPVTPEREKTNNTRSKSLSEGGDGSYYSGGNTTNNRSGGNRSSSSRRKKKKDQQRQNEGYDSDDGEISSIMGGF